MDRPGRKPDDNAFALIGRLVAIAVIAIPAGMLLPALKKVRQKAQKSECSNLKQVVLAFQTWAGGSTTASSPCTSPASRTATPRGSPQRLELGLLQQNDRDFRLVPLRRATFRAREQPKILVCPSDSQRAADTFTFDKENTVNGRDRFNRNQNVSYLTNSAADESQPQQILTGDRNPTNSSRMNISVSIPPETALTCRQRADRWMNSFALSADMHGTTGSNFAAVDGLVNSLSTEGLLERRTGAGLDHVAFLLPNSPTRHGLSEGVDPGTSWPARKIFRHELFQAPALRYPSAPGSRKTPLSYSGPPFTAACRTIRPSGARVLSWATPGTTSSGSRAGSPGCHSRKRDQAAFSFQEVLSSPDRISDRSISE